MSQKLKTVAIIQARLGSTRLPRKVLMDLGGRSMLQRVVDRIQTCQRVDQVVVATTESIVDGELVDYCDQEKWFCVAGSEHDVLSRYWQAANDYQAGRIVRITSDCPLIDPEIVDQVIEQMDLDSALDYACNFHPQRRFPRGLDCEVLTFDALRRIHHGATAAEYREHVTLKIYREPDEFSIGSVICETDHSQFRWTVDTDDDLRLVREIYAHFSGSVSQSVGLHVEDGTVDQPFVARNASCRENVGDVQRPANFGWREILKAYSSHPEWLRINCDTVQKAA